MDIVYMKTRSGYTNDSTFISDRFIEENVALSVPYLILLVLGTLSGSIGNCMVIGAVIVYKVCTVLNFVIGIFPKWVRNSMNSANSQNLINHLRLNWTPFNNPLCYLCLAGTLVASWSFTQEVASSNSLFKI